MVHSWQIGREACSSTIVHRHVCYEVRTAKHPRGNKGRPSGQLPCARQLPNGQPTATEQRGKQPGQTSTTSAGNRSDRVEKSCPIFMKVGPSCSIDSLAHAAVLRRRARNLWHRMSPGIQPSSAAFDHGACSSMA